MAAPAIANRLSAHRRAVLSGPCLNGRPVERVPRFFMAQIFDGTQLAAVACLACLGLGRAMGETIAIYLVIGRQDNQLPDGLLSLAPLAAAGQTLTTKLGGSETWLAHGDPVHWGAIIGLALVTLIWLSTALLQVPCHEDLSNGFDTEIHRRLVATNWIRTVAWSLRSLLATWILGTMLTSG